MTARARPDEAEELKTALLLEIGRMDAKRGWTMQLHFAAMRNLNSRMFAKIGPDAGYDSANDPVRAAPLAAFLDALERDGLLPKTILYSLNPGDYEVMASVMGCFQGGSVPGKMQLGSAWWFNDHIDGMETPAQRAREPRPPVPLRRHAHRLAQLPLLSQARVFPPDPLPPGRRLDRARRGARRFRRVGRHDQGHLLPKRARVFRHRRERSDD
jgi:hypothetical protein